MAGTEDDEELFGNARQVALMRRGRAAWTLLADNPRFAYYGRLVGLSDPGADTADMLAALARLQGAGVCYFHPAAQAGALFSELERRGFETDRHEHFLGADEAADASRAMLSGTALPPDLSVDTVGPGTPAATLAGIAALSNACGVMPVPGAVMRGTARDGVCLFATDEAGGIVATAASYRMHHPASPRARIAMWGLLATRDDRRGEKIALNLGARAILHMWRHHGMRGFMTGVREGNPSSRALCERLGVRATGRIYAQCLDTAVLGGHEITR